MCAAAVLVAAGDRVSASVLCQCRFEPAQRTLQAGIIAATATSASARVQGPEVTAYDALGQVVAEAVSRKPGAWVCPRMMVGITDASVIRSPCTPRTSSRGVTTLDGSVPIRHVPTG